MSGRPTKFKKEYCADLIQHMEKGYSFQSFAGVVGCNIDTLYNWLQIHPQFSDAKKLAFEKSRLFWEKQGIEGLFSVTEFDEESGVPKKSKSINSTLWIFNMKNRFPSEWSDKQQIEHSGAKISLNIEPDGGCEPIKD